MFVDWYCWWLKSCTTWDVWNPVENGWTWYIYHIELVQDFFHQEYKLWHKYIITYSQSMTSSSFLRHPSATASSLPSSEEPGSIPFFFRHVLFGVFGNWFLFDYFGLFCKQRICQIAQVCSRVNHDFGAGSTNTSIATASNGMVSDRAIALEPGKSFTIFRGIS